MTESKSLSAFRYLAVISGVLAIVVNVGAIGVAIFVAYMVGANVADGVIAIWMSLSLGKYFLNAFFVLVTFFIVDARVALFRFKLLLGVSVFMALWNLVAFPHRIAYFYFAFWLTYSIFLVLNRQEAKSGPQDTAQDEDGGASVSTPASEDTVAEGSSGSVKEGV